MPSWERLQEGPVEDPVPSDLDADILLGPGESNRLPRDSFLSRFLGRSFANRYWLILFIVSIILVPLIPTLVIVCSYRALSLNQSVTDTKVPFVKQAQETTTRFLDPIEFDNNSTDFSVRSFSPPEFLPMWDFLYDYLSLLTVDGSNSTSSDNLEVTIFYESLSIPSRMFLTHQLFPTYFDLQQSGNISKPSLSIKLIPYGHTIIGLDSTGHEHLTCEHGHDECQGNLVMACAIRHTQWNQTTSVRILMTFIQCFMGDTGKNGQILITAADEVGMSCSKTTGMNWEPIYHCTQSQEGHVILQTFKKKTESVLKPGFNETLPVVYLQGYRILTDPEKSDFSAFIEKRIKKVTVQ